MNSATFSTLWESRGTRIHAAQESKQCSGDAIARHRNRTEYGRLRWWRPSRHGNNGAPDALTHAGGNAGPECITHSHGSLSEPPYRTWARFHLDGGRCELCGIVGGELERKQGGGYFSSRAEQASRTECQLCIE